MTQGKRYKRSAEGFGGLLKQIREFHGITQSELGAKLDCSNQSILRLENGITSSIPQELFQKICKICKCQIYCMITEEEEMWEVLIERI